MDSNSKAKAICSVGLLVLVLSGVAISQSIVKTLPGFPGNLPFNLETGYVGVDDKDDVQLFYYFIESERNPREDPLLLWLTGGPGCSAFSGLVYEVGNDAGKEPKMNLLGYTIGNPVTDESTDFNSRIPFAHRLGLLSDELYEAIKISCNGEYVEVDPINEECTNNLKVYTQCIENLYSPQILEPWCNFMSPKPNTSKLDRSSLQVINSVDLMLSPPQEHQPWCRNYHYLFSYQWANDKAVQKALHVREGTIKEWVRCNKSLSYTANVLSSVDYHRNLTNKAYRALIYSGDHDMVVPYIGTQEWISSLNFEISDDWKPWFVDGQIAGFRVELAHNQYFMTFATVKGGGHTAPEYKPKECLAMAYRWFAHYYL